MPTTSQSVYTAHDVSDLINVLPASFGFVPQESLCVMATHGPRRRFGLVMRLDLDGPPDPEAKARTVRHHLRRHHADGAIVIAVSSRPDVAERAVRAVEDVLDPVQPIVIAWATDDRYWTTDPSDDPAGTPYERSLHHAAVAHAVAEGRQVLGSREELARQIAPVTGERRFWLDAAADEILDDVARHLSRHGSDDIVEVAWHELGPLVARVEAGEVLEDGELLRLAVWTWSTPVRDALLDRIDRDTAEAWCSTWQHAVRLTPEELRPEPLVVAGFAAHGRGDGAQALVAAEAALALEPEHTLGGLLVDLLQAGIGPDELRAFSRRGQAERPPTP